MQPSIHPFCIQILPPLFLVVSDLYPSPLHHPASSPTKRPRRHTLPSPDPTDSLILPQLVVKTSLHQPPTTSPHHHPDHTTTPPHHHEEEQDYYHTTAPIPVAAVEVTRRRLYREPPQGAGDDHDPPQPHTPIEDPKPWAHDRRVRQVSNLTTTTLDNMVADDDE